VSFCGCVVLKITNVLRQKLEAGHRNGFEDLGRFFGKFGREDGFLPNRVQNAQRGQSLTNVRQI
jgi:hypothetical protein